jgi:hypothetical protein
MLAALQGCMSVPTPADVVQSCNREQASIRGDTHGSARNYHAKVQARCVDDARHRNAAIVEQRGTAEERSSAVHYAERDGEESTQVSAVSSTDGRTTKHEVNKKRENKYFNWEWYSKIIVNH